MTLFQIASILITLAALFSYANERLIRLPTTIGVMLISLACSLALIPLGHYAPGFRADVVRVVADIDFHRTVLHGLLAFLLFAGALHLDLGDLRRECDAIAVLALVGTAASTFLVAGLSWAAFGVMGLSLPFIYCLLFGALIAPTDPIAVLAIMKGVAAPKSLAIQIAAESLFNDGVAVVIFLTVLGVATGAATASWSGLSLLLLKEVGGGAALGLTAGSLTYYLLKRVDNYQVEVLLTLALAMGAFTLADALHVSAPIAVVVAGLLVGNPGRSFAMSERTRAHLDPFWELIDEILNALLFLLIGLEMVVMPLATHFLLAGLAGIGIAMASRWLSVGAAVGIVRLWRRLVRGTVTVLTWGGLRGGLSVAMALSIPPSRHRQFIVAVTYVVVVFSVFAQGLTVGSVIRWATRTHAD